MRPVGTVGIRSESQRLMATRSREGGQGIGGHSFQEPQGPRPTHNPRVLPTNVLPATSSSSPGLQPEGQLPSPSRGFPQQVPSIPPVL